MKLNKLLTVCLALSALVFFSNCNSDDPEPSLEGLWAINELSSTIDIINKNTMEVFVTTDCGFSSSTPSQSTLSTSRLRINADQTGNLNLDGNCVEVENFDFSWQLTDDNKYNCPLSLAVFCFIVSFIYVDNLFLHQGLHLLFFYFCICWYFSCPKALLVSSVR